MSLRYGVLCLLAAFIAIILFLKNYETWTRPIEFIPEKEATKKPVTKNEGSSPIPGQAQPATIASYILIAEKNLFNPERKDFPVAKPPSAPPVSEPVKKPPVRPKITLYGVTIVGDYQAASLTNQGRPLQKGEREMLTVKLGERIGEYKLASITPDRIKVEAEGDSFEVLLYDSTTPKRRMDVRTEVKPATVISTQPAPVAPVPGIPGAPGVQVPVPPPTSVPSAKPVPPTAITAPTTPLPGPTVPTPSRPGRIRSNYYPSGGTPTQSTGGN